MNKKLKTIKAFGFLTLTSFIIGCGSDGGGDGDGNGGDGGIDATKYKIVASAWKVTSTVISDGCKGGGNAGDTDQFVVNVSQTDTSLTLETDDDDIILAITETGYKGKHVTDDGVAKRVETIELILTKDKTLEGESNWSWSDGSEECFGADELIAICKDGGCVEEI